MIVFDVGANDGRSCVQFSYDPQNTVYAFEPTPRFVEELSRGARPNYHVIPKAVSDVSGRMPFYISGNWDWGCSSLNHFNDNLDKTWPGRTDFRVTEVIEVDVIRLDDFMNENNIDHIDYLHVDVQGKDLEVLQSLGTKISSVNEGVIEMPTSHDTKLYKDQKYLDKDAIDFLEKNGFRVVRIEPNDGFGNEVNIRFSRI